MGNHFLENQTKRKRKLKVNTVLSMEGGFTSVFEREDDGKGGGKRKETTNINVTGSLTLPKKGEKNYVRLTW